MNIVWLLPFINVTGGVKVVFELSEHLALRGHQVTVLYPGVLERIAALTMPDRQRLLRSARYQLLANWLQYHEGRWFSELHPRRHFTIRKVPTLEGRYALPADVTLATSFETAEYLAEYPKSAGEKWHYVQGYETWVTHPVRVNRILRDPRLKKIVVSKHIGQILRSLHIQSTGPLYPAVIESADQLGSTDREMNERSRLLMQYHELPIKGIEEGFEAIKQLRAAGRSFHLTVFGQFPLHGEWAALVDQYHYRPAQSMIRSLYRSSDIFIWPSRQEGFGLPPLEAMSQGCAVVSTRSGAMPELLTDHQSGILVPVERPTALASAIAELLTNQRLRQRIAAGGLLVAKKLTWDRSARLLERIISRPD